MRDFGDRRDVFNRAEEIRRLNQDASRVGVIDFSSSFKLSRPLSPNAPWQAAALMLGIGRQHLAIFRMHAARDHHRRRPVTRTAIITASAAAVEPSYIEALATSMPVSSQIMVWNSKIACSVPCEISAW